MINTLSDKEVYYCKDCGSKVYPYKKVKGNILIELILWCFFIIPGLIYTIWRVSDRKLTCPVCHKSNVIPESSPLASQHMTLNKNK